MEYLFKPIGIIHTPFKERSGMPIQSVFAKDSRGSVEVFEEFHEGLGDLEGFSHLHLLYVFHHSDSFQLKVTPFLDSESHGLFATRAPNRPNPIGLSVVRLIGVEDGVLQVDQVDILDGTPLLDIKPFNPAFDHRENCRVGWMKDKVQGKGISDERFKQS